MSSSQAEPEWLLERMRELEESGILIRHPPGWQPPPVRIEDLAL
jgi:DNA-binding Lrp family transcriptional regulator